MSNLKGFSQRLELSHIPEGPGVCIIEDAQGRPLQVTASENIRRRIGALLDSDGVTCSHGPKIYEAQQARQQIFVRWKLTPRYQAEKKALVKVLNPLWGQ